VPIYCHSKPLTFLFGPLAAADDHQDDADHQDHDDGSGYHCDDDDDVLIAKFGQQAAGAFDVDLARRRHSDGIVGVAKVDAGRVSRRVHRQNALQPHVNEVSRQRRIVQHPREVDQFRVGGHFANDPRLALHLPHADRTFRFVCGVKSSINSQVTN
jgi:hypothetical protein